MNNTVYAKDTPLFTIVSPKNESSILGDSVTFSFVVGNFTFVNPNEKHTRSSNEGHLHVWLDQKELTKETRNDVINQEDLVFRHVPMGAHSLTAEIVQNDHSSFTPPIVKSIVFHTYLPSSSPTPSPTPEFVLTHISNQLPKDHLLIIDGVVLFLIGLVVFLLFGRKRFFQR